MALFKQGFSVRKNCENPNKNTSCKVPISLVKINYETAIQNTYQHP